MIAENCPSQLFKVSKENKISKFKIDLSGALQKAQQSPFSQELRNAGINFEDSDYGIQYPSFNSNKNYLAFVLSASHSFLIIYDLKNEKIVYFNRISGVSMNFHWSPDGNYLAFCHPVLKGITPTWVNTIIDIETSEETTLSLSDDKLKFSNWSTKETKKINYKELPTIEDWIQIISDDQFLVQKVDQNETLDLWIINSAGDELKRLTNDGHLKLVSDTRIN